MNTRCPKCNSNGSIARRDLPIVYHCPTCGLYYFVQRKTCRDCTTPIKDEYVYCNAHAAYRGEERPSPDNMRYCAVCLDLAAEDSTYCTSHRDQFDHEHDEYLRRFEEEHRAR